MKTKLLSLFIAISALFCLTSCDGWPSSYSDQISFYVSADCNADGIKKIEGLFKTRGLQVGENITISVIVDQDASLDTRKRALKDKVNEILRRSVTDISNREFHALNTGATQTTYTAKFYLSNEKIDMVVAEHGQPR